MASTMSPARNGELAESREGLDVDWLLRSQKEHNTSGNANRAKSASISRAQAPDTVPKAKDEPTNNGSSEVQKQPAETDDIPPHEVNVPPPAQVSPPTSTETKLPQTPPPSHQHSKAVPTVKEPVQEEHKHHLKSPLSSSKKEGKKGWLSNLGSKFSSSTPPSNRSASVSSQSSGRSPQPSPRFERGNPFDPKSTKDDKAGKAGTPDGPLGPVRPLGPLPPRRPSVLVAAGTETKLDSQPGFLTSALRRLSSSNAVTMGKSAGTGAICPRKVMNIDYNRQRTKISDFDQNKLRRVAFKVDVEIAGIAAQADEQEEQPGALSPPKSQAAQANETKDSKLAKYKDRSEGAALKNPQSVAQEKEQSGTPNPEAIADAKSEAAEPTPKEPEEGKSERKDSNEEEGSTAQAEPTMTRKKEKKKRSEAERKERKERKRRHAQANGLIPLELTRGDDDDSDSSPSATPPGASTPRKDQPTVDPLRIYKRCCQLRETTALSSVKDQISKPVATLAEAPGTVAVIDLSGNDMSLQDITTLGDWLAVVPVRKLVLDDCNLSDEAVRIILSGLSSCKSQEQARANRKLPRRASNKPGLEEMGVIERLSLKNNSAISSIGWKHIALFMHMSRSLRAIDLSGIPFPSAASGDLSRTSTVSAGTTGTANSADGASKPRELGHLIARALAERFGNRLEELILSNCELTPQALSDIVDSSIKCKIKRLGLANNNVGEDVLEHVIRYVLSGVCEGLDLGGNNLKDCGHLLTQVLDESNPLFALSLADTNLTTDDLNACMLHFSKLKNFKFVDFSRNKALFNTERNAVPIFRKHLPKMTALKRIHLADVDMTSDQLISLAEIFPDCPSLAHISILDNHSLVDTMNSGKAEDQEEACAFFVSLMTAVRSSKSIIAIEIEVPSQESSEVVKALASQVVAYSLRNLERATLSDVGVNNPAMPETLDKQAPEVLLHLVGNMEGYSEDHTNDDPAPDEDYLIASTGIVKALSVCLTNKDSPRSQSRNISPSASGTATPKHGGLKPLQQRKPKDVSRELCESARKIRLRLRPALVKEDKAGNVDNYRRLLGLDQTLERMIRRFEDEYPETKKSTESSLPNHSRMSSVASDVTQTPGDTPYRTLSNQFSDEEGGLDADDQFRLKLSRTSSNTSLAARNLTQEEGRMHRFGQTMRREILKPTGFDDALHGTSANDEPEPAHLSALRERLEQYSGTEIGDRVKELGPDAVLREIGFDAKELEKLKSEDPEAFQAFRDSQLTAQVNAGMRPAKDLQHEAKPSGTV